ncbi:MAG: hypothetical protein ACSHXY_11710 [Alphaproteobacteria bacterium]
MMKFPVRFIMLASLPAILGACSSVSLPNVDFLKLPDFQEDAENVKDYPNVADAPQIPTDTRSAGAWDSAANKLIRARDGFDAPESPTPLKSEAEIQREFDALRAKVNAYKKDDPQ